MTEPRLSLNSSLVALSFRFLFSFLVLVITTSTVLAQSKNSAGFAVPNPNYKWDFPRDHGAHPDYQTEWWYFTGQLLVVDGSEGDLRRDLMFTASKDFGFQLTFFSRALFSNPNNSDKSRGILAHAALSELKNNKFQFEKRYQRDGIVGNGIQRNGGAFFIAVGDWTTRFDPSDPSLIHLSYSLGDTIIELNARSSDEPMLQGESGFSRKGSCSSCASHYYSLPGLVLDGSIQQAGITRRVFGIGWMDHEFMSNALTSSQQGWDWISLMTRNGDAIMYFKLRSTNLSDQYSACSIRGKDGVVKTCAAVMTPLKYWRSPRSGARYPSKIRLEVDRQVFVLSTSIEDQELSDSEMSYYEGALSSEDNSALGYIELTGYDGALKQRF